MKLDDTIVRTDHRPKVADLIPRLQLRGPEVFVQHLEATLEPRYHSHLFVVFGQDGERLDPPDGEPRPFSPGVRRGPGQVPRAALSLRRRVGAFRPDVVTAHGGGPLRMAVLAGLHRRAPIVYIRILDVPPRFRTPGRLATIRAAYRQVDRFVARSETLRTELIEDFGVPAERVQVIRNGRMAPPALSTDQRAAVRRDLGVGPSETMVIWVGRLVEQKDPLAALELARRTGAMAPDTRLVMVGGGPMEEQVGAALRPDDPVTLAGVRSDAPRVIAAADLMVSTSVTEGMPGVFVEALMAGVPVVTYDVGGVRELVADGKCGIVLPPGDFDRLADSTVELVRDTDRRARMAEAARRAGQHHDIRTVAEEYDQLYRGILERRSSRRT
jgi:L-malate glycosyltransferase